MATDLLADDGPVDLLADEGLVSHEPQKGFFGNYADYAKGAGLGIAQGLGDVAASVGNFPGAVYEHFSGKTPYHIPHPNLQKYYPEGGWGQLGSTLGNIEGQFIGPGGIAFKALKAFNNPLAKALMGGSTGALAGAASNEGDRIGSGLLGGVLGAGLPLSQTIMKGLGNTFPITKSIASSPYVKKAEYLKEHGLGSGLYVKPKYLHEAKSLMQSSGIMPEAIEHTLPLAHAGEHDAIHAVQSTLKSIGRDLSRKGGVEGRLGEKMHGLAEKIMGNVNDQMKLMGHQKAIQLEEQGKKRYARYYKQKPARDVALKYGAGLTGLGGGYEFLKHLLK
jgi:hypothetical protein